MVQVVNNKSWGSRIMGALWGAIFGVVFVIGAFVLVFWNEGNALHTAQSLEQAGKVLVSIAITPVDPNNEMRVVYLSGLATTEDGLTDKLFNVSEKALQLDRKVEMYQWKENSETKTEKKMGGSEQEVTSYTYKEGWSDAVIDSSGFQEQAGHTNPSSMPVKSKIQYAETVTLGDFHLPADMIKQISGGTSVDLGKLNLDAVKAKVKKPIQKDGDNLYIGDDASTPKIGDMRVSLTMVLPQTISIIAQQTQSTFQPFMAEAGQSVSLLEMGQVSPQQMIQNAQSSNRIIAWILRFVSLMVMILGLALIMKPISVLADVVPLFGSIVGVGTGFIAFVVGFGLWAIAVAIAWFTVRPLWAIGLLAVVAAFCYMLYQRRINK